MRDQIEWDVEPEDGDDLSLLPDWYMPSPLDGAPPLTGWRRRTALLIVASFVTLTAAGLCGTYGHIGF